jgi:hypothetical protein
VEDQLRAAVGNDALDLAVLACLVVPYRPHALEPRPQLRVRRTFNVFHATKDKASSRRNAAREATMSG